MDEAIQRESQGLGGGWGGVPSMGDSGGKGGGVIGSWLAWEAKQTPAQASMPLFLPRLYTTRLLIP